MSIILKFIEEHPALITICLFFLGGIGFLIKRIFFSEKKPSAPNIKAGRDIIAGGDIFVGDKVVGRKFGPKGWLISLTIIVLIPLLFLVWLYYDQVPVVMYEVSNKAISTEGDGYIYDFDFSISTRKNNVLLDERGMAVNELINNSLGLHPSNPGRLKRIGFRNGNFIVGDNEKQLLEKGVRLSTRYRISTKEKKDKVSIKYILDAENDVAKLGPFAIFQPHYKYRLIAEIPVNFSSPETQKGYFKRVR